jgi:erythromycin esterase-like protein
MKFSFQKISSIALACILISACSHAPVKENSGLNAPIPVTKVAEIAGRLANAPILALGETSGTQEFTRFKIELIKELVSAHGYTMLAIEASFAEATLLNNYIHGDRVDLNPLFQTLPFSFRSPEFSKETRPRES